MFFLQIQKNKCCTYVGSHTWLREGANGWHLGLRVQVWGEGALSLPWHRPLSP